MVTITRQNDPSWYRRDDSVAGFVLASIQPGGHPLGGDTWPSTYAAEGVRASRDRWEDDPVRSSTRPFDHPRLFFSNLGPTLEANGLEHELLGHNACGGRCRRYLLARDVLPDSGADPYS